MKVIHQKNYTIMQINEVIRYLILKHNYDDGLIKGLKPDDTWTIAEIQTWLEQFDEDEINAWGTLKADYLQSCKDIIKYIAVIKPEI